ncbi:hypothetical protein TanjilG_02017 [Lupinus angustifolius]|nr:hypothetical protein TanjilG_02017 [Lupinus angustifolius]
MDSSATLKQHHTKVVPKQCDTFPCERYLSSRRTPSFSSSCSSLSSLESLYFHDDPLLSPATPLRFSGVPFSWEHLPGIPKKQNSKNKKDSSLKILPLPPPTHSSKKKNSVQTSVKKDPFFAAMVECSKDDNNHEETSASLWSGAKFTFQLQEQVPINMLVAGSYELSAP